MKNVKKGLLHISIICLVFFLSFMQIGNAPLHAKTADEIENEIKQIEQEQKQLEKERGEVNRKKSETSDQIKQNLNEQSSVEEEISQIDKSLSETEQEIDEKETEISTLNNEITSLTEEVTKIEEEMNDLHNEIKELNGEIKDLEKRLKKREELLRDRLRSMQNGAGAIGYLEVILGSKSFTDFISRATAVSTIMQQDQKLMDAHKEDKQLLEGKRVSVEEKNEQLKENKNVLVTKKEDIEQNKSEIEAQKQQLVALKEELAGQVAEKDRLLAKLVKEEEELVEFELSLEEEQKIIAAQNAALEEVKQGEAERLKHLKASNIPVPEGNKLFIEPTHGRLSSKFGMRNHPIFNEPRMHTGIDIANNSKPPIKAAASGKVIRAVNSNRGLGNYAVILHSFEGEIYATVYGHMSSLNVSQDQSVQAGDVIGRMGTTGDSTGDHLHFEVHKGGYGSTLVDPLEYLMDTGLISER